jgi:hypothetical protein
MIYSPPDVSRGMILWRNLEYNIIKIIGSPKFSVTSSASQQALKVVLFRVG